MPKAYTEVEHLLLIAGLHCLGSCYCDDVSFIRHGPTWRDEKSLAARTNSLKSPPPPNRLARVPPPSAVPLDLRNLSESQTNLGCAAYRSLSHWPSPRQGRPIARQVSPLNLTSTASDTRARARKRSKRAEQRRRPLLPAGGGSSSSSRGGGGGSSSRSGEGEDQQSMTSRLAPLQLSLTDTHSKSTQSQHIIKSHL